MKKENMNILACPVCKGAVKLNVSEEKCGEVIQGALYCKKCDYNYMIVDGIANLLPPDISG